VPQHLLTDKPAPAISLPANATSRQVIDKGIRPLHQWGEEGWSRVRQIRLLQEQCGRR